MIKKFSKFIKERYLHKPKYRLDDTDTIEVDGHILKRVIVVNFPGKYKEGFKGGYIEDYKNLSQNDGCFVFGNAKVYGNAQVFGNAQVSGNAWVYGNAKVYDNAWVYGNARVYEDAWVYGNAWVYEDALVYGNAWVYGKAEISEDARVYGSAKVDYNVSSGHITE